MKFATKSCNISHHTLTRLLHYLHQNVGSLLRHSVLTNDNAQDDPVSAVVVDVDMILVGAAELASIFLPVVDDVWECHNDTL